MQKKNHINPIPAEWKEDIREAVNVMNRGGVILYPTDTIWGIGCDATNEAAVKKVFDIKQRIDTKALIVMVDSEAKIESYVETVPEVAWDLLEVTEKPLTIVYDKGKNLAHNLLGEDGSVAIRMTRESFSKELCMRMKRAIVSTSANISGQSAPTSFNDIPESIKRSVDYICQARQDEKSATKASSIIKLGAGGVIQIIRE